MNLVVTGINFKTTPLALRERLSFRPDQVPGVLQRLKWDLPQVEIVLLSTCNRTEVYLAGPGIREVKAPLVDLFAKDVEGPPADALDQHAYRKEGLHAAEHLFTVASSLDSMVVGETEIIGQVKRAYTLATETAATGKLLNSLFHHAFRVAKRVHNETGICHGRISVSSIAVEFTEKIFDDVSTKTVMIIGAGETSELALQSLVDKGVRDVLVLNRSLERGKALAERCGGKAVQLDLLEDYLFHADIVVSSTNAPHPILRMETVRKALGERHGRPMLFIDIAVPRDIDRQVGDLANVYLYNIDDLQALAAENLAKRQGELEQARAIVREGITKFAASFRVQNLGAVIRQLEETTGRVKEAELTRAFNKGTLATLPETSREEIRVVITRMMNRILSAPKVALKQAARNGYSEEYIKIVRQVFGLDQHEETDDTE